MLVLGQIRILLCPQKVFVTLDFIMKRITWFDSKLSATFRYLQRSCLLQCTDGNLFIDADVVQQGWIMDPASQMFTVKKQPIVKEQKLDPSKLQNLTEYVFYLEH